MSYLLIGLLAVPTVVFGLSAWSKLVAQRAFAASLRPLRMMPQRLIRPVAVVVTAAELAVAVGLGWTILAGIGLAPAGPAVGLVSLIMAGVLLAVLTVGIALALRRGARATCACFGATARPLGGRHLVRNGFLIAVVLAGLVVRALTGDGTAEFAGAVVGLAGGALGALILVRLDDLVELFAPTRPTQPVSPTRS
ncbi:MauE/DoxX family redox-associated membrane protein [Actinophytocola sp.]|uniref:MauE/DoxX family redox-associated membrane protein n=1 Tax=Actinophytocola sp. TaxID=1872138 RepID=UPI003D6AD792